MLLNRCSERLKADVSKLPAASIINHQYDFPYLSISFLMTKCRIAVIQLLKKLIPAQKGFSLVQLIVFVLVGTGLQAQSTLKGKVVDAITHEPLESAVVRDLRSAATSLTDRDGKFVLDHAEPSDSLQISFIGYTSKTIKAGSTPVICTLDKGQFDLKEVIITNHSNNLTTSHTLTSIDLNLQPVKSAQDLLRLVPGLFIAQHQGGGKAEQIFLRGFDADHGTDVNVSIDGMPVNMVSHAHGQGYADLHFLIPEIVSGYDFGKGPYYTDKGDLNTAGYVAYHTVNMLDKDMVKIEGGQFNTGRIVSAINLLGDHAKNNGQSAYIAGEALYSDGGPFDLPEHFTRYNLFGKYYAHLGDNNKLSISLSTLSSGWRSSGEIPSRALAEGYIHDRYGVIDSSQGGYTSRTNANIQLNTRLNNNTSWDNQVFYSHYYFNLITNFTFFYYYPTTGDEFRQHEIRDLAGYSSKLTRQSFIGNTSFTSVLGAGLRLDHITPSELDHTENGHFLEHLQYGKTQQLNTDLFLDETARTGNWLFNMGVRADYFHFYYLNMATDTFATYIYNGISPYAEKSTISPKLSAEYTFNPSFQLYIKAGKGFHSNDARVVIANQGFEILPAAWGADLGLNWKPIPRLFINTAVWYLYLAQEFTFGQDLIDQPGGPIQPSGKTRRIGMDISGRYQLTDWLFASLNLNLAQPRFIDSAAGHNYLPLAPTFTSTAALDVTFKKSWNGSISYRYLHDRAANSTYTLNALGYCVTDLAINYTQPKYQLGLSVENLLNVKWNESQFEYVSRLQYETAPVDDVSFTPGVPFFAKLKMTVFF